MCSRCVKFHNGLWVMTIIEAGDQAPNTVSTYAYSDAVIHFGLVLC